VGAGRMTRGPRPTGTEDTDSRRAAPCGGGWCSARGGPATSPLLPGRLVSARFSLRLWQECAVWWAGLGPRFLGFVLCLVAVFSSLPAFYPSSPKLLFHAPCRLLVTCYYICVLLAFLFHVPCTHKISTKMASAI
jgi:hypothetical protein